MRIVLINAGPRKNGNTAFLEKALAEKYAEDTVERYFLQDMTFKGCTSCLSCRKNGTLCVLKDDMQPLYQSMLEADRVIFLSPNYYGFITGPGKTCIDRWYCLKDGDRRPKLKEDTKSFFVLTQGSPQRDHGQKAQDWAKTVFEGYGMKFYGMTIPNCSTENTDGARLKQEELLMHVAMFL